ncbi:peptide ABC transporter substrate-binding protein [Salinithrix halophila]|uniref:Peptide ABC transporter substrate-binding protein n=1 Tax=Salinithrix halophila TaxID=1485204 RepID=A0ABV8JH64_9BACL
MKNGFRMGTVFLLALVLIVTACTGGGEDAANVQRKVLKLNVEREPSSLDPALAFEFNSMDVTNSLFEGLLRLDENNKPQPAAAEKVKVSPDKTTYTFILREGLKWSNGDPVTAGDFEYAWKRVLDPKTGSPASFLLYFIKNAEAYNVGKADADEVGVTAVDDRTLEVKLGQPTPFFEQLVCYTVYFPVYKEGAKKEKNLYGDAKTYISNGPFKMKEWKHDNTIRVAKNDHYWNASTVKLDGIDWAMSGDAATAYQQYRSGDFHMLYDTSIPPELKGDLLRKGEVRVIPGSGLEFFRFNIEKKPFTNRKIRQAFGLAVERQAIVDQVIQGKEKAALAFVVPGTETRQGDFRAMAGDRMEDAQFDEAKKLLKEGMKEEGWDELPKVTLLFSNNDKNKAEAEALQEMYRKHLGVSIQLRSQESKVFFENQRSKNYQFSRSSFLADYNDPYNYLESFQTDHPVNRTNWSNEEYDKLLQMAFREGDDAKRTAYLAKAEKILFDEMPIFPVYYYNTLVLEKPEVKQLIRHKVGPNDYSRVELTK